MKSVFIHSEAPKRSRLRGRGIRRAARGSLGWISSLLLLALAGCRVPSSTIHLPVTVAVEPSQASAIVFPVLASSESHASQAEANGDAPVANRTPETEQPVRLVALESDQPTGPAGLIGPLTLADAIHLAFGAKSGFGGGAGQRTGCTRHVSCCGSLSVESPVSDAGLALQPG